MRPILEYCGQAWCPWLRQDIDLLENVQRRAVCAVSGLNGTYEEKLLSLNMLSLEQRRLRGDMIETYKLLHNFEDIDPSMFFYLSANHHNYPTRHSAVVYENIATPSYETY